MSSLATTKTDQIMNWKIQSHRILLFLIWVALAAGPRASAQTPPGLTIQLSAGLRITGEVGTIYSLEYLNELGPTNDWRCLTFLQLPGTDYVWLDPTAPITDRRLYRAFQTGAPTNMVFIPPGTFRMGSPTNEVDRNPGDPSINEGPQTAVSISQGFWMGIHEVTQGEYQTVTGTNPSAFKGDPNRPVDSVSWFDATNYCGKLTLRERVAGRIPTNCVYRLPTEAEWEYASRAWTSTRVSYGDDPDYNNLSNYAWYDGNSGGTTHTVGQKSPNPWGLYDMHGNVGEWCQDWYGSYPGGIALNPQGPATGTARVSRGGPWLRPGSFCRSAFRIAIPPNAAINGAGFRVVLATGEP